MQHMSDLAAPVDTANFYLEHSEEGVKLSRTHTYYYQIQGQLTRLFCYFVCGLLMACTYRKNCKRCEKKYSPCRLELFYVKVIHPQMLCPNATSVVNEASCSSRTQVIRFTHNFKNTCFS